MLGNVAPTPHLRMVGRVVTVGAVIAILSATLLPDYGGEPVGAHLCLVCGTAGGVDVILNILLFVPLGVGLALRGIPARRAIFMMLTLSLLIESAQLFLIPGRDATVGDVLTNTLGGALGFAASRYARTWLRPSPRQAAIFFVGWGALWLGIQTISCFAFAPSITGLRYYGQVAPSLRNFDIFPGSVRAANLNELPISNTALADSRAVAQRILNGATVATSVVPGGVSRDIAPIVRLVDEQHEEILILAQNGADLLFAVRTGGATLRLRAPLFALPEVFPRDAKERQTHADILVLSGRYVPNDVTMKARGTFEARVSHVPLEASLGWTLILPWQWFIEGTRVELIVSLIWLACLTLPLGYWAHCVQPAQNRRFALSRTVIWPVTVAIVYGGLALAPNAFGLAVTTVIQWLAALAGVAAGAALAVRFAAAKTTGRREEQQP